MAEHHHVSIPQAGHVISAYAMGFVVGAPILTAFGGQYSPKSLLLTFMIMFTVFNGISALAPDFYSLMVFRFLAGLFVASDRNYLDRFWWLFCLDRHGSVSSHPNIAHPKLCPGRNARRFPRGGKLKYGELLGGIPLAMGFSYASPQWVDAAMSFVGVLLALILGQLNRL